MEVCRLCLDVLTDKAFLKLEESYKKIINDLIPEVNFEITSNPVICNQCSISISEVYNFKILYSKTQHQLQQNLRGGPKLTEKEILHNQHFLSTEKTKEKLCRTCLENIENNAFTILKPTFCDAFLESMLAICLPDLDLEISIDPVMCEKCFNVLQKFHNLKIGCQDVEEKLKKYQNENSNSLLNLHTILNKLQENSPFNNGAVNIKNEAVDELSLDDINDVINGLHTTEDLSTNVMIKQEEELHIKMEV